MPPPLSPANCITWAEVREIAQLEVGIAWDAEDFANRGEHFRLLDGIDAEVGFHVQVRIEHLDGVAGLFGDDGEHLVANGGFRVRITWRRQRNFGLPPFRAPLFGKAEDVSERREVAQFEVGITDNAEGLPHGGEHLGLFDSVDTEVGLQIQIEGEHLDGIAGFLGDDGEHLVGTGVSVMGVARG